MQFEQAKSFILDKLEKELPARLTYHSVDHTKDVLDSSKNIAVEEGVTGEDLTLLLTAALFHDSGYLVQQTEHERISCDISRKYLPDFGYTDTHIDRICGMIMATRIPQTPHNKLEEILADADLDYLGREDFFTIGGKLFTELRSFGILDNEEDWNRLQLQFLEAHHYFTDSSIRLRKMKKEDHLNLLKLKTNASS